MKSLITFGVVFFAVVVAVPQVTTQTPSADDLSGAYSFLQDGEFVQITVEPQEKVSGFVSRYGDLESDQGTFLDHFFKTASLRGRALEFATEIVHGTSFNFEGVIERGPGKDPSEEAYWLIKGTLTQLSTDSNHQASSRSRQVEFKSFPRDTETAQPRN